MSERKEIHRLLDAARVPKDTCIGDGTGLLARVTWLVRRNEGHERTIRRLRDEGPNELEREWFGEGFGRKMAEEARRA